MDRKKNIKIADIEPNKGQIEGLPQNPRFIKDNRFKQLVKSIEDAPEMLDYRTLMVVPHDKKFVVICGNMRFRACKELGYKELPCYVLPEETPAEKLREYAIKDNIGFGADDWDILMNEWDTEELKDWGMVISGVFEDNHEGLTNEEIENSEEEEIRKKEDEFRKRMEAGEINEEDEEYQEFVEKFKAKKTTDDCYTPKVVYDAVADYVERTYGVNKKDFVRPFYPNGDFKNEKYPKDCIVVDNPPFSILADILDFYIERGIKFFLFAPHLTLFSSASPRCTSVCVGVVVTYENGANVNTSFLTNMEDENIRAMSCPKLYTAVKNANDENLKEIRKELQKYSYDWHVVTAPMLAPFSRLGIDFVIPVDESVTIRQLDSQKDSGKSIFGNGLLISERLYAEREKAEREKAVKAVRWELSERERMIIKKISK